MPGRSLLEHQGISPNTSEVDARNEILSIYKILYNREPGILKLNFLKKKREPGI